jgi:hypothetical protein
MPTSSANWESFALQIPGEDLLEPVRAILEVLVIFLEILKTLLETVKVLLILFANAVIALVEALISLILTLFEALKRTGFYAWWNFPDLQKDPNLNWHYGGYQKFLTRFKGSCINVRDPNRPQPIAGATASGFILLVVDADLPLQLIRLVLILKRFFGQDATAPQYRAPSNVKVLPVGSNGDPVLSVVDVFEKQPTALVIEWSLPSKQASGDAGQRAVFADYAQEFVPPNFLIEKSATNPNVTIDVKQLSNATAAGLVTQTVTTNFEVNGQPNQPVTTTIKIPDYYNNPFIKFQKYISINPLVGSLTFFLGQLGTFRYIDTDVQPGQTYWYRVRATNGDMTINPDGSVPFTTSSIDPMTGRYYIAYPGGNPSANVGKASPIHSATVPVFPPGNFDVISNLKALFKVAFSLNFHLPLPGGIGGATFSSNGSPIYPTTVLSVGLGSLTQMAGPLTSFQAVPLLGSSVSRLGSVAITPNPAGTLPQAPWQVSNVIRNATRLSIIVAGALLNTNNAVNFQKFMTTGFPKSPAPDILGIEATNLSQFVLSFTSTSTDPAAIQQAQGSYAIAFSDLATRLNILAAVNYVKVFLLVAAPPDWKSVSLLRDIIPWAGQLLYELIAKIQALLAAFQGLMAEITAFINLIERKINILEQFIEYLISILDFLLSLEIGLFVLFLPGTGGDISSWFAAIDGAGGSPPTSGPNGYTAGLALAYIGVDIGAFATALQLIF